MLMTQIAEDFENFLGRITRKLIPRLRVINGELPAEDQPAEDRTGHLLAELRMAVRLRAALDDHIRLLVVARASTRAESLLDETLGVPLPRPTWKEIGEALGVSAQAAHRKYGQAARGNQAG